MSKRIIVMGSCRFEGFEHSGLTPSTANRLKSGNLAMPNKFFSADYELWVNPTGYSVSLFNQLDKLKCFFGLLDPVDNNAFGNKEVHKYCNNDLLFSDGAPYDGLVLEAGMARYTPNTPLFKKLSGWQGRTLSYNIQTFDPAEAGLPSDPSNPRDRSYLLDIGYEDFYSALKEIIYVTGLAPHKIHIFGQYLYPQDLEGANGSVLAGLPEHALNVRRTLNANLKRACENLGCSYHDYTAMLGIEEGVGALDDAWHLSKEGHQRVSTYIKNTILPKL